MLGDSRQAAWQALRRRDAESCGQWNGRVTTVSSQPTSPPDRNSLSYFELGPVEFLARLWRRKWILLVTAAVGGVLALASSFLTPPTFRSAVTMLPERNQRSMGALGPLAAITGIFLDSESSYEELYREILMSDHVLNTVIRRNWLYSPTADSASFFTAMKYDTAWADSLEKTRAEQAIKKALRLRMVKFTRSPLTGYMVLQVDVPRYPLLAASLANHLAGELEVYNLEFNRQKASNKRIYVEERLDICTIGLSRAESALADFVTANRAYSNAPELVARHNRLAREVGAQETVWLELRRQLELARIEENSQMSTVNVLDRATVPLRKSSPHRGLYAVAGMLAGGFLAIAFLIAREQIRLVSSRRSSIEMR